MVKMSEKLRILYGSTTANDVSGEMMERVVSPPGQESPLEEFLRSRGKDVKTELTRVSTMQEALNELSVDSYDLVIAETERYSEYNGHLLITSIDAMRLLKKFQNKANNKVKIIAMGSGMTPADAERMEADGNLDKPFVVENLFGVIYDVMYGRKLFNLQDNPNTYNGNN